MNGIVDSGLKTHIDELKPFLQSKFAHDFSFKQINDLYLNCASNFFKHKVSSMDERVEFELETEAILAIIRASYNAGLLTSIVSDAVIGFFKWLTANSPDLIVAEELENEP